MAYKCIDINMKQIYLLMYLFILRYIHLCLSLLFSSNNIDCHTNQGSCVDSEYIARFFVRRLRKEWWTHWQLRSFYFNYYIGASDIDKCNKRRNHQVQIDIQHFLYPRDEVPPIPMPRSTEITSQFRTHGRGTEYTMALQVVQKHFRTNLHRLWLVEVCIESSSIELQYE